MTEQEIAAALVGRRLRWGDEWGMFTDKVMGVYLSKESEETTLVYINTDKGDHLTLTLQQVEVLIEKGKFKETSYNLSTTYKLLNVKKPVKTALK